MTAHSSGTIKCLQRTTWTTERIELLKSRFAAGLSCREIADDIGVSRNAVIGKLSRLNLTREKKPRQTDGRPQHEGTTPRIGAAGCSTGCCGNCTTSRSPRPSHDERSTANSAARCSN